MQEVTDYNSLLIEISLQCQSYLWTHENKTIHKQIRWSTTDWQHL